MGKVWKLGLAVMLASASFAPVQAQDAAVTSESATAEDKMAVATRIASQILPEGSYAEMTTKMLLGDDSGGDATFLQMFDFPMPADAEKKMSTGKTMLDVMEENDPYFRERMTIAMRIFAEEMRPIMLEMEPLLRSGIAGHLVKTMSYDELVATEAFFHTPAGQKLSGQMLLMWMSPEMMQASAEMIPAMFEIMPGMMARLEEETSHLPKPEREWEEGDYEESEMDAEAAE